MAVEKVLHVIPSVGALRGGPSVLVRRLASSLSQEGIETHVATTDDNGPAKLDVPRGVPVPDDGVTYWYFPRQTHFYTFSWPLGAWLAKHIPEFDLVHIHGLFSYAALPAAYFAHGSGVPYIVRPLGTLNEWGMTNRRPWLKRLSFHLFERRVLAHASLVHYTSDQERLEAERFVRSGRGAVIPNAVPECFEPSTAGRFRANHPQVEGRAIVLFLSRFDAKKGVDLLLTAFADVRRTLPNVALVLAGDGDPPFVSRLKAEADALGIGRDIVWTGFLNDDQKRAVLADADVFVLPSRSENFGIAVAEAMAAGLPVVVSDQIGIHDEISRAHAGLVVPCDVRNLAGAVIQLLRDERAARAMGDNGRRLVSQRYSPHVVARHLIHVYNAIAH